MNTVFKKVSTTKRVIQRKFNVQTSHYFINCSINISPKFLEVHGISVTKTVLVLFPTFSKCKSSKKLRNFKLLTQSKVHGRHSLDFKKRIAQYLSRHKPRSTLFNYLKQ